MAGIAAGKAKYAAKTSPGGIGAAKWNASKGRQTSNYVEGLRASGITVGPLTQRAHSEGVSRAEYKGGNPDKWERNYIAGMSQ